VLAIVSFTALAEDTSSLMPGSVFLNDLDSDFDTYGGRVAEGALVVLEPGTVSLADLGALLAGRSLRWRWPREVVSRKSAPTVN
jgi:hypothetical protein